ncbi:kinesin-like protein KIF24 [Clinocottus analis]|uniref:kinesin-like protein KIF24 n=1 Tax=Clinocottus analis TaxID=304258 RepID=UPI0035BF1591
MEDYPDLGIRSMEDRTRLFHLVQMVKALDLEYEDDGTDYDADGGEEGYPEAESSFDGCVDPDDDEWATRTAGYNYGLPLSSPAPNKKQHGGQRISVCLRKRPLTHTEFRRGEADVVTTQNGECVIVHESKEAVDLSQYTLQHRFYFDQVFGEKSSNEEVYQRTAYPLVQHMLSGGNATCFAYGQTGAGKTHTMLGSPLRPGLYALAVLDIFAYLSTTHMRSPLLVYVSFFEIYCGQLYDLLDHRKRLFAREDGHKVVHIVGLRDTRVDSVISQGTEERTQGMSGVNPLSSRSHALLRIQLKDTNQQIAGRMWFVDLAGSERASDSKEPDRQSRMEGAEINQSLLALKECIRSLDQEQSHTPFRQSKLTQVLKDSFVGNSMTCMIANISPGHLATEHTLNTLRYADRVKELKGQIGLRGGIRSKTIQSSKSNRSNSSSSIPGNIVVSRGKSPPKKPKLGRQRENFGLTSPTTRLTTEGFFCPSIFLFFSPKHFPLLGF